MAQPGNRDKKENSNSSFLLNSSPANLGSLHKEVKSVMRNGKDQHCPDDGDGSTSVSFMLEEPRSSLKEGFNIEVRSSHAVSPLQTQIAGHGSENDGQRGLLVHESGFVLKPVQAPPKGTREVAFYQSINSSGDEVDQRLVQLTARFYGTQAVKVQNGVVGLSDYLVLENLTQGLGAPCVMDVKIGARTYGPDASEAKKSQEDAKYQGTKVSLSKLNISQIFLSRSPLASVFLES